MKDKSDDRREANATHSKTITDPSTKRSASRSRSHSRRPHRQHHQNQQEDEHQQEKEEEIRRKKETRKGERKDDGSDNDAVVVRKEKERRHKKETRKEKRQDDDNDEHRNNWDDDNDDNNNDDRMEAKICPETLKIHRTPKSKRSSRDAMDRFQNDMIHYAIKEVHDLHRWYVKFFHGNSKKANLYDKEFVSRFHTSFTMIKPDGTTLLHYDNLIKIVKNMYFCNPDIAIKCRNVEVLNATPAMVVVRYEEYIKNSLNEENRNNARLSTGVLVLPPRGIQSPNGLQWLTIHETWLPEYVLIPENFRF